MATQVIPEGNGAVPPHMLADQNPVSAIPKHVRHISKGGSGDYTRDPSVVLQSDANKALHMLKKLAAEPDSEGTPKASKQALIPLDFFKRCKGIQFVTTKLGGLFVSVERGHSFTIQRLGTDNAGLPLWSGPCFGTVSNFGVGLTAGFDALDSIIILSNQKTVDKLKKASPNYGVDINLIVGKDTTLAQTDDTWTEDQTAAIPYSLGGGALLDISFKGGAHTINERKNKAIYGPEATPEVILSGGISAPPEFLPVFELINKLAAASVEGLEDNVAVDEP